jgi:hypothetical protein
MTGSAFSREDSSKAVAVRSIPEYVTRLGWVAYWKEGSLAKQVIYLFSESRGTTVYASPSIWQTRSCKLDATRSAPTDLEIYMVDVNHARRIRSHGCTSGEQAGHDRSRKGSVFRHDLTPSNVPRSAVDKRLIINPPDLSMGDWLIIKLPKNSNVVPP